MVVVAAVARRIAQNAAVWWMESACVGYVVARVVRRPLAATFDQSVTLHIWLAWMQYVYENKITACSFK